MAERWCWPLLFCSLAAILCEDVYDLCSAGADLLSLLLTLAVAAVAGAWVAAWAMGRRW